MKRPSRLTVLTATLLVLLPTLAVLQYRWVGQLGDAARDRMQRNLHNAAQQFQDSFDTEIARAFVSLQADRELSSHRYAERYAAWSSTTAYPWMVANVYVVDAPAGDLRLHRWDPAARAFTPASWDGPLAAARPGFVAELASFKSGERRPERAPFRDREDLLVAPLAHLHFAPEPVQRITTIGLTFGFTIIQLNVAAIRDQLLPSLAHRYFSQIDDEAYRVAVIRASTPAEVVYRSSADAPTDPSRADVSVPLFHGHDPMLFFARAAVGTLRTKGDKRDLFVSVIREERDDRVTMRSRMSGSDGSRWRLLAQHGRGSLDAAVGDVRQRNLLVSFGILLLMGVSIGLLALSSRRAQQVAQQRMELVAGVSHELRTPVAVIHSAAENLSQGVVGDPARVRRYGEAIEREARRLGEMVERVLHFAGIESGRIVRTAVAIEPLVAEAIDAAVAGSAAPFVIERHIAAELPPVLGEATALRSAIQNLIANAMKYGGADRWICIRAESGRGGRYSLTAGGEHRRFAIHERSGRKPEVRIVVEDHGTGIPASDLPHIFDAFYRGADATRRQIQGTGLGLALVRAIAQAHGGGVSVLTREGAGSTFTLHLPAAISPPEPLRVQSPNEAAAG